ncbi:hypothetical protein [Alkalihalobacillus sp. 1P02AB]|uniref:hypothetical protein n=1 Tax=Alkalihalobacillus sp. 1P02AB TaxID=3132260 RepID=UPI0039A6FC03
MFSGSFISIGLVLFGWSLFLIVLVSIYRRDEAVHSLWRVLLVGYIGLFSYDFSFQINEIQYTAPILPLGVFILVLFLRKRENGWAKYKKYAWIGFAFNFLFFMTDIVERPLHNSLYDIYDLETLITNVDDVTVFTIHPSGEKVHFDPESFYYDSFIIETFNSITWYDQIQMNNDKPIELIDRVEKFPYMMVGVESKKGSGFTPIVYIEEDSLGLLIQVGEEHLYFRTNDVFLEWGTDE